MPIRFCRNAPALPGWLKDMGLTPVFLIHDLIPITHPQFCRSGEDARHVVRMRQALEAAAGIIANSATTRDALASFAATQRLPMPPSLIAWLAADKHGPPAMLPPPTRPYFLMIGTIEARKNHLLLLHLWERLIADLGDAAPELVVIGQRGWEAEEVFALLDRSPRLKNHVRELGRCDDATMLAMLAMLAMLDGARALLMPSFIESFGLPMIEALQRGVPVIASDLPVFREIAGDIPLYLGPLDGQGWDSAIRDFTGDCPARAATGAGARLHPTQLGNPFQPGRGVVANAPAGLSPGAPPSARVGGHRARSSAFVAPGTDSYCTAT